MVTKFQTMVNDVLDSDFEYQMLNDAVNEIETMQAWEQLKKELTFTGTSVTMPTREFEVLTLFEYQSRIPYVRVPFEQKDIYRNLSYYYYIDLNTGTIHLTSTTPQTMNLFYTQYTADLTASDTWIFPSWCHSLVPIIMAKNYYAVDAGDKALAWDDRWAIQQKNYQDRMSAWDDRLKLVNRRRVVTQFYSPTAVNDYNY